MSCQRLARLAPGNGREKASQSLGSVPRVTWKEPRLTCSLGLGRLPSASQETDFLERERSLISHRFLLPSGQMNLKVKLQDFKRLSQCCPGLLPGFDRIKKGRMSSACVPDLGPARVDATSLAGGPPQSIAVQPGGLRHRPPDHLLHGCAQGNSPLVPYTGFGLLAKYFVSKKPRFLICFHNHKPFKEDGELKPCCVAWSHFRWAARGTRLPTLDSFDKCMFPSVSLDLVRKSV